MKTLAAFLFLFAVLTTRNGLAAISEIGVHTPILKVEKNENPQNLMIVYTKFEGPVAAAKCEFAKASGVPVFDEYWLMDGTHYKPVNPMIKNAVRDRFEVDRKVFSEQGRFVVHLKDFSELKSDLGESPTFQVTAQKKGATCVAEVVIQLGPSDHNRKMEIASIYADSSHTVLPPFRKLEALTLRGKDLATGEKFERTYRR